MNKLTRRSLFGFLAAIPFLKYGIQSTLAEENFDTNSIRLDMIRIIENSEYQYNGDKTRNFIKHQISKFDEYKLKQLMYDYTIICDERNNTPDIINSNDLVVEAHYHNKQNLIENTIYLRAIDRK